MKTTIIGSLIIIAATCTAAAQFLQGQEPDYTVLAVAVTTGIGFIKAADQPKPLP